MARKVMAGVALAMVWLAGCVDGSPVDPSMCEIHADSLVVKLDPRVWANCPSGKIVTEVPRP